MIPAPWLNHAWQELGQREVKGAKDNARILSYYRDAGHPNIKHDEVPWCAAFLGAVLARAGLETSKSLMARSYLKWGQSTSEARLGAIAVFSRGSNPSLGHVGFVVGESSEHLWILGGNQKDAVTVAKYPKRRLLGLRWPFGSKPISEMPMPSGVRMPDVVLAHLLDVEGGYTNDPVDPGGPTNKGITLGVFAKWTKRTVSSSSRAKLVSELKRISDATVRDIYETRYWKTSQSHTLSLPVAFMHMDAAVNHGVGTAIRFLQRAVGVEADGEIGPVTRAALAKANVAETLKNYADIRRQRYRKLKHFWRFGRGWLARVDKTLARSEALHASWISDTSQRDHSNPEATTKMKENNMPSVSFEQPDTKWWGQSLTIWGAIVTAASTVLPALAPVLGWDITADMVQVAGKQVVHVVQALTGLMGTAMTIYGRIRASRRLVQKPVNLQF